MSDGPSARHSASAGFLLNTLYVFGGTDGKNYMNDLYFYNTGMRFAFMLLGSVFFFFCILHVHFYRSHEQLELSRDDGPAAISSRGRCVPPLGS